jgi:hypothetical protein
MGSLAVGESEPGGRGAVSRTTRTIVPAGTSPPIAIAVDSENIKARPTARRSVADVRIFLLFALLALRPDRSFISLLLAKLVRVGSLTESN